ncbi:Rieske 2Fe-2S domain-containing protein [Streptomyces sp. NPDC098781]|uniref:Rieske 2Fe-2S domain-containing protein n=1 Tax=Streptomyces sp. NPDC098781 TaxID=3366097 RepID=UPI003814F019
MSTRSEDAGTLAPPDFETARTRHQRTRASGMDPDYWYPVALDREVARGKVVEVSFWGRSMALFRGSDGTLRALDNRCAHRQLKLSAGQVEGCNLVCLYHGWSHDGEGRVADIPHDLFGRPVPKTRIRSYPVRTRYQLIWLFPGNPELAEARGIPELAELEGGDAWPHVIDEFTVRAHHSVIMDNVSDFTHAYLHRKYEPFSLDTLLTSLEPGPDSVRLSYRTKVGGSRLSKVFVNERRVDTGAITLCYEYPFQWSDTGKNLKEWCFVLPIDERTTRVFFLFAFSRDFFRLPLLPMRMPCFLVKVLLRLADRMHIRRVLEQDRVAVEAEQEAYEAFFHLPVPELNPAVKELQALTVRKWQEHLDRTHFPARP